MHARHILLAVLVALLWGGNFVAVKLGTREFPPVFLLALRFSLVAALMLPFVKRLPQRCVWPVLLVSIALGGLHFGLMFAGVARVEASTAAIATQLGVPFSTLLAVLLFKDSLGWRRVAGIVVAFAGVVVLAGAPETANDLFGLSLVVAAAFAWAVANAIIKHYGPFDTYMLTAWMALFAVPQLLAVSFALEAGQWQSLLEASWVGWAALGYTVLGSSIVAYGIWYTLINHNPVSQVVPFTLLAPVFAVAAAWLMLGEPLTLPLVLGGLITIAGVALCELRLGRRRPQVVVPPE
jgi:O-acetylserine/cysteine efflux transporter